MTLRSRVTKLEQRLLGGRGGCRACCERQGRVVLTTAWKSSDGTVVRDESEPEPCASCGKVPEQIIVVIKEVLTSRDKISQSEAGWAYYPKAPMLGKPAHEEFPASPAPPRAPGPLAGR